MKGKTELIIVPTIPVAKPKYSWLIDLEVCFSLYPICKLPLEEVVRVDRVQRYLGRHCAGELAGQNRPRSGSDAPGLGSLRNSGRVCRRDNSTGATIPARRGQVLTSVDDSGIVDALRPSRWSRWTSSEPQERPRPRCRGSSPSPLQRLIRA